MIVGCSDDPVAPTSLPAPAASVAGGPLAFKSASWGNGSATSAEERLAAESLARAVALALSDAAVRQEVKAAFATSDVRERKLHFASFMQGRGGRIVSASARRGALDAAGFARAIASVRDLEFYMPVGSHRSAWAGGPEVLVAAATHKRDIPVAFTTSGERRVLGKDAPPSEPTLVLVQVETDFKRQIALNEAGQAARSCDVGPTETLEGAAARCTSSARRSGDPSFSYASTAQTEGLHAVMFSLNDAHEYWFQGNPELEAHSMAKRSRADGSAHQFQCSGEHAVQGAFQPGLRDQAYVYDQNPNTWSGDVLLLNPAQLDTAVQAEFAGFNIVLWEDDQDSCRIRQRDSNFLRDVIRATVEVIRQAAVAIRARNNILEWAIFGSRLFDLFTAALGDDDYVGVLVEKAQTSYSDQYPDASHIVFEGTSFNGRARLELRSAPGSTNAVTQVFVTPYPVDNVPVGATVQLEAKAYDYRGRLVDRPAVWWSSNPGAISVSSSGVVTAAGEGSATIFCSVDGVQSSRNVTAYGPVARVDVSPSYTSTYVGGWVYYTATPYDSHGTFVPNKTANWSSSATWVATIDASGWAQAVGEGSTQIYAEIDGVWGAGSLDVGGGGCGGQEICNLAPAGPGRLLTRPDSRRPPPTRNGRVKQ
jgi:hypothetical protein